MRRHATSSPWAIARAASFTRRSRTSRASAVVGAGVAERGGDAVVLLLAQHVLGAAGDAVQLAADVQQHRVRLARPHREVDELGHGQRVQRLRVAQPAAGVLEVRFEQEGALAGDVPALLARSRAAPAAASPRVARQTSRTAAAHPCR